MQQPLGIPPIQSWQALPKHALIVGGPVTAAFAVRGIRDFQQAGAFVQSLAYRRNANPAHPLCVLEESTGTCSTKHALLARLALEQDLPVQLTLGIYKMREANTPGAGVVLDSYNLPFMLEAHCYLTYRHRRIDATRTLGSLGEPIGRFLHEEPITPDQIGAYKVDLHRRMLRAWIASDPESSRGYTLDQLWGIREACIAALGE